MIYQGAKQYPVTTAVLHCAGINTGQFNGMRPYQVFMTVNRWHRERGFKNGFGYHGLIMPDGTFYAGRPYTQIGAHVLDHNRGTLGFLLIEKRKIAVPQGKGLSEQAWLEAREFDDYYTDQQRNTLLRKLAEIPGLEQVRGHNDYAQRLCPGFKVKSRDWCPNAA